MKTTKLLATALAMAACTAVDADAQGFLDRLGKRLEKRAEEAITRKAEQATDKAIDKVTDADTYRGSDNDKQPAQAQPAGAMPGGAMPGGAGASEQAPQQGGQPLELTYAKNDFVPGDEIFFEDLVDNEQLGEFPSMWDLLEGTGEIVAINGKKAIARDKTGVRMDIAPLMKDMKNYLPEKFTMEMDLWMPRTGNWDEAGSYYRMYFYGGERDSEVMEFVLSNLHDGSDMQWSYTSTSGKRVDGEGKFVRNYDGWYHLAISFNQRAFKAYINGVRIANIPNMTQPTRFMYSDFGMNSSKAQRLTNVRFAKGAVPLYDRMMSEGKFITYGITFDVGKSTIKPESMGEINRIVQLMNENPELKFSVEGHTDSTGNAAANQTLSEARAKAIVDKLVELGVANARLTSAGKGQNNPIADNTSDEGRAKNRRVEFVKM